MNPKMVFMSVWGLSIRLLKCSQAIIKRSKKYKKRYREIEKESNVGKLWSLTSLQDLSNGRGSKFCPCRCINFPIIKGAFGTEA